MNRLTCKYDVDNVLREMCTFDRESDIEADDCLTCHEYCNNKDMNCEHCAIQRAFDKLAEFEDLEEKGLLLKLPFKVGDKIYHVENDHIYEFKTNSINIRKENEEFIFCISGMNYKLDDVGKILFMTIEEAEEFLQNTRKNK